MAQPLKDGAYTCIGIPCQRWQYVLVAEALRFGANGVRSTIVTWSALCACWAFDNIKNWMNTDLILATTRVFYCFGIVPTYCVFSTIRHVCCQWMTDARLFYRYYSIMLLTSWNISHRPGLNTSPWAFEGRENETEAMFRRHITSSWTILNVGSHIPQSGGTWLGRWAWTFTGR